MFTVPENHTDPGGRQITLPITRLPAHTDQPGPPVFLLYGGPGLSNTWAEPPLWLQANHDLVMVGYRGVDGVPALDGAEIVDALRGQRDPLSSPNLETLRRIWANLHERLAIQGGLHPQYATLRDVVADLDAARAALGYERICLYSQGYGTRVAYLYGQHHPDRVECSVMVAPLPSGGLAWDAAHIETVLRRYADLWAQDAAARARTPDLLGTLQAVLSRLPFDWGEHYLDRDKVRVMAFLNLFHTGSAAMVFDAFVAAEQGDFSGMAMLWALYDQMIPEAFNWGDFACKAFSADLDPARDYAQSPPGAILGAPLTELLFGSAQGGWPGDRLPESDRSLQPSDVPTLLISGDLDFATPEAGVAALLSHLRQAQRVQLPTAGHVQDLVHNQPTAFAHLVQTFLATGQGDASQFVSPPVNFTPPITFQQLARGG